MEEKMGDKYGEGRETKGGEGKAGKRRSDDEELEDGEGGEEDEDEARGGVLIQYSGSRDVFHLDRATP